MRHFITLCLAWLLLVGPAVQAQPAGPKTGFLERSLTVGTKTYPYRVYLPESYKPGKAYPVVLYLHGVGEWGQDNELQMGHGLGSVVQLYSHKLPQRFGSFIGVFPQLPAPELWTGNGGEAAMQALDKTVTEFSADASRLYVTGLSLGGYGALHLAALHPGKFAAVAPLAGGVLVPDWFNQAFASPMLTAYQSQPLFSYAATAKALGAVPIWVFHGTNDEVVPVTEARQLAAALKAAGHAPKYTEYPAEGHFIADNVYTDAAFWQWLMAQKLPKSSFTSLPKK